MNDLLKLWCRLVGHRYKTEDGFRFCRVCGHQLRLPFKDCNGPRDCVGTPDGCSHCDTRYEPEPLPGEAGGNDEG